MHPSASALPARQPPLYEPLGGLTLSKGPASPKSVLGSPALTPSSNGTPPPCAQRPPPLLINYQTKRAKEFLAAQGATRADNFLTRLWLFLISEPDNNLIYWHDSGRYLIIPNEDRLVQELVIKLYKQNSYGSFARQLNIYGFKRITNVKTKSRPLANVPLGARIWQHATLTRDSPVEELAQIKRKAALRKGKCSKASTARLEELGVAVGGHPQAPLHAARNPKTIILPPTQSPIPAHVSYGIPPDGWYDNLTPSPTMATNSPPSSPIFGPYQDRGSAEASEAHYTTSPAMDSILLNSPVSSYTDSNPSPILAPQPQQASPEHGLSDTWSLPRISTFWGPSMGHDPIWGRHQSMADPALGHPAWSSPPPSNLC